MKKNDIMLRRLKPEDTDLADICTELNGADWEASIKDFSESALCDFLSDPNHFYLLGYEGTEIAGAIHGYVYPHPTGVKYMWIDEVDTMVGHRRRGVARTMMLKVLEIAAEYGCAEAWLGSDDDRAPAIALYESLEPTEVEHGPTYSWKIKG
jgi:ribosomal protein S18 acetylase RimI-like enzyme